MALIQNMGDAVAQFVLFTARAAISGITGNVI